MQSADLDAISHFPDLSNNWSRLLLPASNSLKIKIPDANTRERILQRLQSISMGFLALFTASKSRVMSSTEITNGARLSNFVDNVIWHYANNFASSHMRLECYCEFCKLILMSDGQGNMSVRPFYKHLSIKCRNHSCAFRIFRWSRAVHIRVKICWINVARGWRLAARPQKIVQLVEKIMYDCSLLSIYSTRGKTLWSHYLDVCALLTLFSPSINLIVNRLHLTRTISDEFPIFRLHQEKNDIYVSRTISVQYVNSVF